MAGLFQKDFARALQNCLSELIPHDAANGLALRHGSGFHAKFSGA